jgi:RNA-binding protein Musashi
LKPTFVKFFIGGLLFTAIEKDMSEYFGKYGNIVDAIIMKGKDNKKSRGFGFITFEARDNSEA